MTQGAQTGCFGPWLSPAEHADLVQRVLTGDDPAGPDVPWAVAVRDADGSVAAACSTMLSSGLFWALTPAGPAVGLDPLTVAHATGRVSVDPEYVRAFSRRRLTAQATPFLGVTRVPAGCTVRWSPHSAAPVVSDWVSPVLARTPDLGRRAPGRYIEVFDGVVQELVSRQDSPIVVALSGGLDSTFVMSSLQRTGRPVTALTHRPLAIPDLFASDEFHRAAMMRPDRHRGIRKQEKPLVAARYAWQRSGVPVFAPDNQTWINAFDRLAPQGWWTGAHGNAAFSYHHPYATTVRPARRRLERAAYLRWLLRSHSPLAAAANPSAGPVRIDPFCARSVMAVAARIRPRRWRRGGSRGFARQAGRGRVPDPIRLDRSRGQQSADAWHMIRDERDDYLQQASALGEVPGLEHIDAAGLVEELAAWAWGTADGPPLVKVFAVNRLLALADFAREVGSAPAPGTLLMDPARVASSAPLSTSPSGPLSR